MLTRFKNTSIDHLKVGTLILCHTIGHQSSLIVGHITEIFTDPPRLGYGKVENIEVNLWNCEALSPTVTVAHIIIVQSGEFRDIKPTAYASEVLAKGVAQRLQDTIHAKGWKEHKVYTMPISVITAPSNKEG